MKITNKLVKSLGPCTDRYDNYLMFYKTKTHSLGQFMGLRNITHEDKLWVCFRLMPNQNLRFCASDLAELVLPMFESKYPNDNRPRLAIEAARTKVVDMDAAINTFNAARNAAYYAAYAAAGSTTTSSAARNAAYAAAQAADCAAHSILAYPAAYASHAPNTGANAAAFAISAMATDYNKEYHDKIRKQIRSIVLKYMK